jgi:hypothetical protein
MLFLQNARRRYQARVTRHEHGSGIPEAVRLKSLQFFIEFCVKLGQADFRIHAKDWLQIVGSKDGPGVPFEARFQLSDPFCGQCKPRSLRVTAEAFKEITHLAQGREQVESPDRTPRAYCPTLFHAHHERGPMMPIHNALGHDANHASMPALARENQRVAPGLLGMLLQEVLYGAENFIFHALPVAVQAFQPLGDGACTAGIGSRKQVDDVAGIFHAAGSIEPRGLS